MESNNKKVATKDIENKKEHKSIVELITGLFGQAYGVVLTFIGLILWIMLAVMNAHNTSYLNTGEHVLFTRDSALINILVVLAFIAIMVLVKDNKYVVSFARKLEEDEKFFLRCKRIGLLVIFAMAAIWVLSTQAQPGADQRYVQDAVLALKNQDYSAFKEGGYVSEYPNQIGIIVISYVISLFIGDLNFTGFEIINAVCVALFYKVFIDIQAELGFKKIHQFAMTVAGVLFLPLIMYSSFVYGTVMGLLFSTAAFKYEIKFFKNYKAWHIILACLFMGLAIMAKNNFLIAFVAFVAYGIVEIICQRKWLFSWTILLMVVVFLAQSLLPRVAMENITGEDLTHGSSSWSWIAMGLRENDDHSKSLAPGWYSGYNAQTYREAEYDTDKQTEIAKEKIEDEIDGFKEDKAYALSFFSRKIASMWSEPSYESFWITQIRQTDVEHSDWTWKVLTIDGSQPILTFLNYFQFVIYVGCIFYLFLCRKGKYYRQSLVFLMVFIGGFLFHLAWEAKGQYSLTYFPILFMYAIAGYVSLVGMLSTFVKKLKAEGAGTESIKISEKIWESSTQSFIMGLAVFLMLGISVILLLNSKGATLGGDTEKYADYVSQSKTLNTVNIANGDYTIMSAENQGMYLVNTDDGTGIQAQLLLGNNQSIVHVFTRQGTTYINFAPVGEDGVELYLDMYDSTEEYNQCVDCREYSGSVGQAWQLMPVEGEEDTYYIVHDSDYCLTYDQATGGILVTMLKDKVEDKSMISDYDYCCQKWKFTSVDIEQ